MIRRLASIAVVAVLAVAALGVGYWAGRTAVAPPDLPIVERTVQTYTAQIGTVEQSIPIPVTASWPRVRTLLAGSEGVVTSVLHRSGEVVEQGDVLATVNLEPIVAAVGSVPMFRIMEEGVTGPDVAQLQELLLAEGHFEGPVNGRFDSDTMAAVMIWQEAIGAGADATVDPGALLFVERLPARVEVLPVVGTPVSIGSELVQLLGERPDFTATVAASRRAELVTGMAISINRPAAAWQGELGEFEPRGDGSYVAAITGDLCGGVCGAVATSGETALSGTVELVPCTEGVIVPDSALVLQPSGRLAVTLDDGNVREVEVLAEAEGFAVVEGLEEGTVIQLPSVPGP